MVESDKTNDITSTGILDVPVIGVNVKGTEPTKGWIELEKGNVKNYSMVIGEYVVTKGEEIVKNGKIKTKPSICEKVKVAVENSYSLGDEYICNPGDGIKYTFYLLEDGDNNSTVSTKAGSISLIMNKNIDNNAVEWSADGINDNGPVTALPYLLEKTSNWTDVDVSLPTYNQILNINGTIANLPEWIYLNVSPYGYWTDTMYPKSTDYPNYAWQISTNHLFGDNVKRNEKNGVRPVITISKSSIKE